MKTLLLAFTALTLSCASVPRAGGLHPALSSLAQMPEQNTRRIVGYVIDLNTWVDKIDAAGLTHLNIAFFNPGKTGAIQNIPENLKADVAKLKKAGVKVSASIGGQYASETMDEVMTQQAVGDEFIGSLLAMLKENDLDGVDWDLEGALVKHKAYNAFTTKLGRRLKKEGYLFTVALTTDAGMGDYLQDGTLEVLDWINMMAYDQSGPNWGKANTPHASMEFVNSQIAYWVGKRQVPAHKLVLGVPFYAWNWVEQDGKIIGGYHDQSYFTWGQLVKRWPDKLGSDEFHVPGTHKGRPATFHVHFNNEATLRSKAVAARRLGGLMIWQLAHDDYEQGRNLLKMLNQVYRP